MELLDYCNAISSVGFPIVMCLILLYKMDKQETLYRENEKNLRDVIERNTLAINDLCNKVKEE